MSRLAWRDAVDGYLFILPWLAGFVVFTAGPMVASLVMVFIDWDLLTPPMWAGFANLERLVNDRLVGVSLYNTAYYTFWSVPLRLIVAMGGAMLLNAHVRGLSFFRTAFYLPAVLPIVASSILWMWMYNPQVGLFNQALQAVGLPRLGWLWDPELSKPSLVLMSLWSTGNVMIIFLAGLQSIPAGLYEAADIDGAAWWDKFRHVTVPMLSPVILFNLVMGVIYSFQVFAVVFLMTGGGGQSAGGPNNSTLMTVVYLYRIAFEQFKMGYGSAVAWLLFFVILIFTLIQWRLSDNWVYYEGKK
ncbi:MAG: sugar ABC transporter permease [Chloroflexota bacterium]|nr:MAG: sugar ABC transporter permease [Chloroflexota bacterium]